MTARFWIAAAIARLRADTTSAPRLHVLPPLGDVEVLAVDESVHPGGIKYRSVRDLLLHDLREGHLHPGTRLVEASASNTGVATAHFARLLGLPLTLVAPARTPRERQALLASMGAELLLTDRPAAMYDIAREQDGHFLDHIARAGTTAAYREDGLARVLASLSPSRIVVGVGTGVTSATIARYLRHRGSRAKVVVADAENSAYFPGWASGVRDYGTGVPSRIPGIGRPRMEAAFDPDLVEYVIPVPDAGSVAAMRWAREVTGVPVGPSTGANLWAVRELARRGMSGPIATVFADAGYLDTFHNPGWVAGKGIASGPEAGVPFPWSATTP
ncbi:PLP-dependent cysteine synthase family protein [Actinorhabdospora filicis]|uniref:PLP-dependent cysteine synthase family protein n=1 Tax=Actinorhabdospora filicis TaxID=1785913 RepID=UPI002556A6D3|nr:pyridoxal-phosphate dependent enzyme [Actinorhabdospora filicis]